MILQKQKKEHDTLSFVFVAHSEFICYLSKFLAGIFILYIVKYNQ